MRAFGTLPPGAHAVVLVGATSLFMVLVAWATLIGPDEVFTGPGLIERAPTQSTRTCVPLEVLSTAPDGTVTTETPDNPQNLPYCDEPDTSRQDAQDLVEQAPPPLWVKVLTWTFLTAVLGAMLALAVFVVMAARDRWRRPDRWAAREQVEFTTLDEPGRLVEAISEDASEQDDLLREGDPRNAIVAAWLRFEVQGDVAGVGRRSWETSSEYAIRILDLVSADSGAVNRLAGLYREARFSDHPITEEHRAEALEALTGIRRSLGVRG
jgi:hypothetical protein